MKKYIVYAILMAGTTLSSCSSSFLDQEPPLYIEPGDIYNDANRLEAAVLGLYGSIKMMRRILSWEEIPIWCLITVEKIL